MSHFSTIRTKLKDAEMLKASLQDLGINVKTYAEVRGAGCQRVQADVVAVLEGDYDIGWARNEKGSLSIVADLWGVSARHDTSGLISSINQKYAVNKALADVKRPGLQNANVKVAQQW